MTQPVVLIMPNKSVLESIVLLPVMMGNTIDAKTTRLKFPKISDNRSICFVFNLIRITINFIVVFQSNLVNDPTIAGESPEFFSLRIYP